jgi:hypothetical protein
MYWDVMKVLPKGDLTLWVIFADGTSGSVKFLKKFLTGVFEPLKEPEFFKQAFVSDGVVMWPGEVDLAPDAMYYAIKQKGEWVVGEKINPFLGENS